MRVSLAQLNYHIGNFSSNKEKILRAIEQGREEAAELVVFSELAVCGYPPRDFLEFDDFIHKSRKTVEEIASQCKDMAVIVGGPSFIPEQEGRKRYNSAFFLYQGKVRSVHNKALLPTYDIFDEDRYFRAGNEFKTVEFKGKKIALTICEDLWDVDPSLQYEDHPMQELAREAPDFMINIAASPFDHHKAEQRRSLMKQNVEHYGLPLFYAGNVGAQTELIFDGGSMALNSQGSIVGELKYFEEDFQTFDTDEMESLPKVHSPLSEKKVERIRQALVVGVRDYFSKLNFKKAIVGLSGGIDSALTLIIAVQALGKENVYGVLMPSNFSSNHSVSDSEELLSNLGCSGDTFSIEAIRKEYSQTLEPRFSGTEFGIAEENIQARIRGTLLMALSNKFGHILLNTSNKSEAAVGYSTLYGDMCGGLSVLGDVYKTEVYELAAHLNQSGPLIPQNILDKPPSAELRPDQKDSDSLPPYEALDPILFEYIEERKDPQTIIDSGYDETIVRKVLKLVNTSEYKRHQTPPVLRVSNRAFGIGRRMPLVGKYLS